MNPPAIPLQLNKELFQSITDNMLDAALLLDWDGTIMYGNRAALKLVGLSSFSEALGNNAAQFIHPDSLLTVASDLERVRLNNGGFPAEYRLITHQGEEKWVEGLGTRILIGEQYLDLVILRDITDRKSLEEELRRASEEMENRVQERTALLTEANQRLQNEIIERKRATEALRESEEKYRTFPVSYTHLTLPTKRIV